MKRLTCPKCHGDEFFMTRTENQQGIEVACLDPNDSRCVWFHRFHDAGEIEVSPFFIESDSTAAPEVTPVENGSCGLMDAREKKLIAWFRELYAARTRAWHNGTGTVDDALPEFRVRWSEIDAKMLELGYVVDVVSRRIEWDRISQAGQKTWARRLERTAKKEEISA